MATSHLSPAPADPALTQSESHKAAVPAAAPPAEHPDGVTERRPHPDAYGEDKTKILKRLRRIEGQVRGISRMVEEDKYCIDILTQISAIVASTRSVGLLLLEDHIRGCVVNAGPDEREATLEELNRAIERFTRSVGS
ncbi:MAG TPA: metal-sensitive transcriptional regulator [Thermomicrobiales bacterium]|nr:metal-sensitive transcriptional regulator [Thermomicrobiales bacterium]